MKSTEFIIENIGKERIQNWAKLIKKDCQPYLSQVNPGTNMYRGLNNIPDSFTKKRVRLDDRSPYDMPQKIHDDLNTIFTKQYGAPFRNALFVSGDYSQAKEYGKVFRIYPMGDFEFIWSPVIDDLYTALQNFDIDKDKWNDYITSNIDIPTSGVFYNKARREFRSAEFVNFVEAKVKYSQTDLQQAIDSKSEIMIRCKSYYAIDDGLLPSAYEYLEELLSEK